MNTSMQDRYPRSPGGRASKFPVPFLFLASLSAVSLATAPPAAATHPGPFMAKDTLILNAAPAQVQKPPVRGSGFWEPIREVAHSILDLDTRILRYTVRYTVSNDLATKIVEVANEEGVDPELVFRVVRVESRFHQRARSPVGALGLMQLMPGTARRLNPSLRSEADILEPSTNLRLGTRYLRAMIQRYGDVRLGLLAYNRGPGAVDRALRQGRDPENGYSRKVLGGSTPYRGPGLIPKQSTGRS